MTHYRTWLVGMVALSVMPLGAHALPDKCTISSDANDNNKVTINCEGNHSSGITESDMMSGTTPAQWGEVTINLRNLTHDINTVASRKTAILFGYDLGATTGNIIVNNQIHDATRRTITGYEEGLFIAGNSGGTVTFNNAGDIIITGGRGDAVELNAPQGSHLVNTGRIIGMGTNSNGVQLDQSLGDGALSLVNRNLIETRGDGGRAVHFNMLSARSQTAGAVTIHNESGGVIRTQADRVSYYLPEAVIIPISRTFSTVTLENAGLIEAIGSGGSGVDIVSRDNQGESVTVLNKSGGRIHASGDLYEDPQGRHYDSNGVQIIMKQQAVAITVENGETNAPKDSSIIATGTGGRGIYVQVDSNKAGGNVMIRNHARGTIATRLPRGLTLLTQGDNPDRSDAIRIEAPSSAGAMTVDNAGLIEAWRNGGHGVSAILTSGTGGGFSLTNRAGATIDTRGALQDTIGSDAVYISAVSGGKAMTVDNSGTIRAGGSHSRAVSILMSRSTGDATITNRATGIMSTVPYPTSPITSSTIAEHGIYIDAKNATGDVSVTNQGHIEVGHQNSDGIYIDAASSTGDVSVIHEGALVLHDETSTATTIKGGSSAIELRYKRNAVMALLADGHDLNLLSLTGGSTATNDPNDITIESFVGMEGGIKTGAGVELLTIEKDATLIMTSLDMGTGSDRIVVNGTLGLLPRTYNNVETLSQGATGRLYFLQASQKAHADFGSAALTLAGDIVLGDDFEMLVGDDDVILETDGGLNVDDLDPVLQFASDSAVHNQYSWTSQSNTVSVARDFRFVSDSSVVGERLTSVARYLDEVIAATKGDSLSAANKLALKRMATAIADEAATSGFQDGLNVVSGAVYGAINEFAYQSHQSFMRQIFDDPCHLPVADRVVDVEGSQSFLLFDGDGESIAVGGVQPLPDSLRDKEEVDDVDDPVVLWDTAPHRSCEFIAFGGGVTQSKNSQESAGFDEYSRFMLTGGIRWRPVDETDFTFTLAGQYQSSHHQSDTDTVGESAGVGHHVRAAAALSHDWLLDDALYDVMVGIVGGYSQYDIDRRMNAAENVTMGARGKANIATVGARAGNSIRFALSHWFIEPFAHYDWTHIRFGQLDETGDTLALSVGAINDWMQTVSAGLKVGARFEIGGGQLIESDVTVSFSRLLHHKEQRDSNQLLLLDDSIVAGDMMNGFYTTPNMLLISAGWKLLGSESIIGSLTYDGVVPLTQHKVTSHSGRLQLYF